MEIIINNLLDINNSVSWVLWVLKTQEKLYNKIYKEKWLTKNVLPRCVIKKVDISCTTDEVERAYQAQWANHLIPCFVISTIMIYNKKFTATLRVTKSFNSFLNGIDMGFITMWMSMMLRWIAIFFMMSSMGLQQIKVLFNLWMEAAFLKNIR